MLLIRLTSSKENESVIQVHHILKSCLIFFTLESIASARRESVMLRPGFLK